MKIQDIKYRNDLGLFLKDNKYNGFGVEIGVQSGTFSEKIFSTWQICEKFYLVDLWKHQPDEIYYDAANFDDSRHEEYYVECRNRFSKYNNNNNNNKYEFIRKSSEEASRLFPDEYFDFIYIDANHSYDAVMNDLKNWYPKIKKNGIFCGHDYEDNETARFGVKSAVDSFFNEKKIYTTSFDNPSTKNAPSWIVVK